MANQKKQTVESKENKQQQAQAMVDDLMQKSLAAFEKLRYYSQEQVDKICQAMALAAEEHHMDLAVDAAKETDHHRGSTGGNRRNRAGYEPNLHHDLQVHHLR